MSLFYSTFLVGLIHGGSVRSDVSIPYLDTPVIRTGETYDAMVKSLNAATRANKIGIFVQASAAISAKRMGKIIPGNVVVELYRPDFVVWLLKASVRAVISAPIRFYIAEDPGTGKATLTCHTPSSVFSPCKNAELGAVAPEYGTIFAKIAADAVK